MSEREKVQSVVDACVTLCLFEIEQAVEANPNDSPSAIRMTVLDTLTAVVIHAVAISNVARADAATILTRHVEHVAVALKAIEERGHGKHA